MYFMPSSRCGVTFWFRYTRVGEPCAVGRSGGAIVVVGAGVCEAAGAGVDVLDVGAARGAEGSAESVAGAAEESMPLVAGSCGRC